MEVIGDRREVEPDLLGAPREPDQLARAELLRGEGVPDRRYDDFLPLFFPPFLPPLRWLLFGALAILAARCLLIPRLRSPSYCLSS
jgi:hypothetical protein